MILERWRAVSAFGAVASVCLVAGCTTQSKTDDIKTSSIGKTSGKAYAYSDRDKECLARAMFFESNRSSRAGLVAVGTVVMNRLHSGQYADTICGVVGQKGQFAPGVLSRGMNSKALPDVQSAAEAVLKGERHPSVGKAMFFHQAGLKFPYKNMHYVLNAGGNSFYEKRSRRRAPVPQIETEIAAVETPAVPALSYEAKPEAADAIGALILTQDRPLSDYRQAGVK